MSYKGDGVGNTTFLSNKSFVLNGDLFKIMEARYPQSIYDENGEFDTNKLVSCSLELVRWLRNCESYFESLIMEGDADDNQVESYKNFKKELNKLIVSREIFNNFAITEISAVCTDLYQEFQLDSFRQASLGYAQTIGLLKLDEWCEKKYPARSSFRAKLKELRRFDLNPDKQVLYDGLLTFLDSTEEYYCLTFDLIIQPPKEDLSDCTNWVNRTSILKFIFENALEKILITQSLEVLRFYAKCEDNGSYGQRFHTIVFLRSLKLTENAWFADLNQQLKFVLADKELIKSWLFKWKDDIQKVEIRPTKDETTANSELESGENFSEEFFAIYPDIAFELTNWNAKLKELCPHLEFHIDSSTDVEQKSWLEYWAVKYLFVSEKYIYINPHIKKLNPTIRFSNNTILKAQRPVKPRTFSSGKEIRSKPSTRIVKQHIDEPPHSDLFEIARIQSDQITSTTSSSSEPRRRTERDNARYSPESDFTLGFQSAYLDKTTPLKSKNKFSSTLSTKSLPEINVGAPKEDEFSGTSFLLEEFIEKAIQERKKFDEKKIKKSKRIEWAYIFYKNKIKDSQLSDFLIQFEYFCEQLLGNGNLNFAILPHGVSGRTCSPDDLTQLGKQYLLLFSDFHTQRIKEKIRDASIQSDYCALILDFFKNDLVYTGPVYMVNQIIVNLSRHLKAIAQQARDYEKKFKKNLDYLKYHDDQRWAKVFDKERLVLRLKLNIPLNDKQIGIGAVFDDFKKTVSGRERRFKDLQYIRCIGQNGPREFYDVLFILDCVKETGDPKELLSYFQDQWIKAIQRKLKNHQTSTGILTSREYMVCLKVLDSHKDLAVNHLYIPNATDTKYKLLIGELIPFFISQAIFLQKSGQYGKRHQLRMSADITKLFSSDKSSKVSSKPLSKR